MMMELLLLAALGWALVVSVLVLSCCIDDPVRCFTFSSASFALHLVN